MTTIATIGPRGSHAWQAAQLYNDQAELTLYPTIAALLDAFAAGATELAIVPIYNTREGEIRDYFRNLETIGKGSFWIDNIILPIHLSLGALDAATRLTMLIGSGPSLQQCEEYLTAHYPDINLLQVHDTDTALQQIKAEKRLDYGIIEAEEVLKARNFVIRDRELVSHNRTRFAVLGRRAAEPTGYDATALISRPLPDRVGLLYDILGEFSRRGINLLDLRSESDVKTQKLQIFIEAEGHIADSNFHAALSRIEQEIVQEPGAITTLGSYPRLDMRPKIIQSFGFIGTGAMSTWFARRLTHEGYTTILTGRSTAITPEAMIQQVDVVVICVPISATPDTVRRYAPLLRAGQALVLLAGAAANILECALAHSREGVEVMLVHNLWGPQAATMKGKTASVVRTSRSGPLCSEFEAFLYKHGADLFHDSADRHDTLMGINQKLPTCIAVAMAMTMAHNDIAPSDMKSHATLTSAYGMLAMSRIHNQNDRTYAEIMATKGSGRKIIADFIANLERIQELVEQNDIDGLAAIMEQNRTYLDENFLAENMNLALAVDEVLGKSYPR